MISALGDGYGTFVSAAYMAEQIPDARFLGFWTRGHAWVGHNDAVMAAIAALVLSAQAATAPCTSGPVPSW
jgi:hypothetical protein